MKYEYCHKIILSGAGKKKVFRRILNNGKELAEDH